MRKIIYLAAVMVAVCSSIVLAEGLDSLVDLGKSMADISKAMGEETKAFEAVKADVDNGDIKKGMSQADIRSRYGEPVIANEDSATKREKWVYKPASSSFFEGIRIYLFFDDKGTLDEIKTLP